METARDDRIYPRMHYFVFKMAALTEHSIVSFMEEAQRYECLIKNSPRITRISQTKLLDQTGGEI